MVKDKWRWPSKSCCKERDSRRWSWFLNVYRLACILFKTKFWGFHCQGKIGKTLLANKTIAAEKFIKVCLIIRNTETGISTNQVAKYFWCRQNRWQFDGRKYLESKSLVSKNKNYRQFLKLKANKSY